MKNPRFSDSGRLTALAIALALVVIFLVDFLVSRFLTFSEPIAEELTKFQEYQLQIYTEMTRQLVNLSTLVIGAVAVSYREIVQSNHSVSKSTRHLLHMSLWLAALSIYLGYLSHGKTVWMLSEPFFNLNNPVLYTVRTLQFWSFICSVLLLAGFWVKEK